MAWPTATTVCLQHLPLFPAPLQVKKKARRSAFRRFSQRRPALAQISHAENGPLDDIIHQIAGDIWHSPLDEPGDDYLSGCTTTFEQPFAWNVTPLPVSRTPSDQPLRIPKTRNSRSSGSGSTFSDILSASQSSSKCEYFDGFADPSQHCTSCTCSFSVRPLHIAKSSVLPQGSSDQLSTINETGASSAMSTESQSLRKRITSLTASVGRMRFGTSSKGKARSISSFHPTPARNSPSNATSVGTNNREHVQGASSSVGMVMKSVTEEAYKSYEMADLRNGHSQVMTRNTTSDDHNPAAQLAVTVKVLPEVQLLSEDDTQTFWVTIEAEGVLHDQHMFEKSPMDFIFLIDLAYYVTDDCLYRAESVILDMLSHLSPIDRVGLYTTHCTHEDVTGTSPETLCPLKRVTQYSRNTLRDQLAQIPARGSQRRNPPRPNPSMTEVIRAVTQSIKFQCFAPDRTHLFLLSPSAQELHAVSSFEPELYIDHINPAIIPFTTAENGHHQEFQSTPNATVLENDTADPFLEPTHHLETKICHKPCCHNITVHNLAQYESLSDTECGRRFVQNALYKPTAGILHNVFIDLKQENGCSITHHSGSQGIPVLRLGQTHSFSASIKISRSSLKPLDLDSLNPMRLIALNTHQLRADLHNALASNAELVHPLSAQAFYQVAPEKSASWACTETPMTAFKSVGELDRPRDAALEVYRRRFHQPMAAADAERPMLVGARLLEGVKPEVRAEAKKLLEMMANERKKQRAALEHAAVGLGARRFLGRTGMAPAHDWEE